MNSPAADPATKQVGVLELLFDLVFVFAVAQLVGLLHGDRRQDRIGPPAAAATVPRASNNINASRSTDRERASP